VKNEELTEKEEHLTMSASVNREASVIAKSPFDFPFDKLRVRSPVPAALAQAGQAPATKQSPFRTKIASLRWR